MTIDKYQSVKYFILRDNLDWPTDMPVYIATNIVLTAICCHNLMRMRYPAIQNATMEDDNNNMIPGEW